jgi:histidinol-phosphatase
MTPSLLEAVEAVARAAGDVAMRSFGKDVAVRTKADGSLVSDADVAAERRAREWIGARFPNDAILGEEMGATGAGARRWILDPIDGTSSYLRGVPLWGTLVAIAEGERVLAGAVYCPAVGEITCAAPGQGCWWNGSRARVSTVSDVADALVLASAAHFTDEGRDAAWRRLAAAARMSRTWGDCYGYLMVATGRADVMLDPALSAWDSAALFPVVTEAGGVFTDWSGRPTGFGGSAIATNAALGAQARALLGVEAS